MSTAVNNCLQATLLNAATRVLLQHSACFMGRGLTYGWKGYRKKRSHVWSRCGAMNQRGEPQTLYDEPQTLFGEPQTANSLWSRCGANSPEDWGRCSCLALEKYTKTPAEDINITININENISNKNININILLLHKHKHKHKQKHIKHKQKT